MCDFGTVDEWNHHPCFLSYYTEVQRFKQGRTKREEGYIVFFLIRVKVRMMYNREERDLKQRLWMRECIRLDEREGECDNKHVRETRIHVDVYTLGMYRSKFTCILNCQLDCVG